MKKPSAPAENVRAVVYARYSSHGQTEQSIEGQLHDAYAWAEQQNVTIIGEDIDRALTGTKDNRPDFQRMIDDASKRQFQMVIVWKLDRFARNRYDSAIYKARLKKYGVRVVSVKENITDSPEGIILEGLLESMAEYYSANLSQNIRRGQRETIAKGLFCGGPIPFGYKLENKKLVADDKLLPAVRYIFEQYAQGVPKKDIIDTLTARGVRMKNGKPISNSSFARTISNTAYIGDFQYSGQIVPGLSEPLIDRELFDRVQKRIALNRRTPAKQKAAVDFLLTGKIWCGHCGATMAGDSGRSHTGDAHYYYACRNKKQHHTCRKRNERKEYIEDCVVTNTLEYILTPARAQRIASAVVAEYNKEFSDSGITDLEKAIAHIDRELDKLVDALIDTPKAARARINDRITALDAQKSELETDLAQLRIAAGIRLTETEVLSWLHKFSDGNPDDPDFRKRLIDTFINAVYVYDDRLVIFYNIRPSAPTIHPTQGSDFIPNVPPIESKSEPKYIFINGVFGCIFTK